MASERFGCDFPSPPLFGCPNDVILWRELWCLGSIDVDPTHFGWPRGMRGVVGRKGSGSAVPKRPRGLFPPTLFLAVTKLQSYIVHF